MKVVSLTAFFLSFLPLCTATGGNAAHSTTKKYQPDGGLRGRKVNGTAGSHPRVAGVRKGMRSHHGDSGKSASIPVPLSTNATAGLFEGDIVPDYESIIQAYGPTVAQELEDKGLIVKGNSTHRQADVNRRWTTRVNGVVQVPYAFSGQHNANAVAVIESALKKILVIGAK